jgi:PhnB protein
MYDIAHCLQFYNYLKNTKCASEERLMQVETYLHFNGQCEAALKYYQRHLGAEILFLMHFKGSPAASETPVEWQDKVIHSTIRIGDVQLMASDGMYGHTQKNAQGFSLSLTPKSNEQAENLFAALSENGTVTMPLQKTFFAERFGSLIDQFGIPWMIHLE